MAVTGNENIKKTLEKGSPMLDVYGGMDIDFYVRTSEEDIDENIWDVFYDWDDEGLGFLDEEEPIFSDEEETF